MATILIVDDLLGQPEIPGDAPAPSGTPAARGGGWPRGAGRRPRRPPDLVITDVLMPVMDGYEFVRQLRLDPATSAIPVVFYTAHYGEREARALALSSGVVLRADQAGAVGRTC